MSLLWCSVIEYNITDNNCKPTSNGAVNNTLNDNPAGGSNIEDDEDYTTSDKTTKTLYLNVIFIISLAGIVGNCLSALVLRCDVERREAVFMLFMLALADTGYLVCAILAYPTKYILAANATYYLYVQVFIEPLLKTFQATIIWLTVLATVERYIFVTRPFTAQKFFTYHSRRLLVGGVLIAAVAFTLPRFFERCIETYTDPCTGKSFETMSYRSSVLSNSIYLNIYKYGAYVVCLYIIPLLSLAVMNLRLACAIRASVRRKSQQQQQQSVAGAHGGGMASVAPATSVNGTTPADDETQRAENNATLVLVMIVVVFIVCQTPELIIRVLVFIARVADVHENLVPDSLHGVSELLVIVNSSVNFVIYTIFRRRFRIILTRMLTCHGAGYLQARSAERVPMMDARRLHQRP